ncbi:MAG: hypothetical protein ABH896_03510 [Candidatus Jacksonbacteria bacterium]
MKNINFSMRIMLAGSFCFAKEIIKVKKQLEDLGHTVLTTEDLELYADAPEIKNSFADLFSPYLALTFIFTCFILPTKDAKEGIPAFLPAVALREGGALPWRKL